MDAMKKVAIVISIFIFMVLLGIGILYNSPKLKLSVHEYACDAGVQHSCNYASVIYLNGKLVKKDVKKAESLAKKACRDIKKDKSECLALGYVYFDTGRFAEAAEIFWVLCPIEIEACKHLPFAFIKKKDEVRAFFILSFIHNRYSSESFGLYRFAQIYALLKKPMPMMYFLTQALVKTPSHIKTVKTDSAFSKYRKSSFFLELIDGEKDLHHLEKQYSQYQPCEIIERTKFTGVAGCHRYQYWVSDTSIVFQSGKWQNGIQNGKGIWRIVRNDTGIPKRSITERPKSGWYEIEGNFAQDSLLRGEGLIIRPQGSIKVFYNKNGFDKKKGLLYENGDRYIGENRRFMRDGKGKFVTKDGKVYEGVWEKDQLIKPTPESDVWPTEVQKSDRKKNLQHNK